MLDIWLKLVLVLVGIFFLGVQFAYAQQTNFIANPDGSQEVPPVSTTGTGIALFELNAAGTEISFRIEISNLDLGGQTPDPDDDVTGAHIHSAPLGDIGGVVVGFITPSSTTNTVDAVAGTIIGTIDSSSLIGSLKDKPFSDLVNAMILGNTYVNIHTAPNLGGEIRGQIQVVDLVNNPIPQPIPKGSITIDLELVASDLIAPVHLTHAGDGSGRLFIVDQPGEIRILNNAGTLLPTPFLDIKSDIIPLGIFGMDENNFDERGLLGLAFHPNYANAGQPGFGKLYTFSSQPVSGPADFTLSSFSGASFDNQNVIHEWEVDQFDSNVVDVLTKREVMRVDEPQFNHQGGMLEFGPDGYLYIAFGDGGGANDNEDGHGTIGNSQDRSTILGTIVRIDPLRPNDNPSSLDTVSANGQYRIPTTNPFLLDINALDEIYAVGFRNPWRFSFDSMTGDLIVADVGQNLIEEIDIVQSGGNYGWSLKEGTFAFDRVTAQLSFDLGGLPGNLIDPVAQYDHDEGISITGGFVYRGQAIPELFSRYIFGDFSSGFLIPSGRLFHVNLNDGEIKEFILAGGDPPLDTFVKSTGQDEDGELYFLVGQNLGPFPTSTGEKLGKVLKIVPSCTINTALNVDTIISSSCTVTLDVTAGGSVTVQNGAVMTIPSTVTLDINFATKNLIVEFGGGVLIQADGKIT